MANNEEISAVLQYITDHPEEHNQRYWSCGHTACFAGHTALRAGWEPTGYFVNVEGKLAAQTWWKNGDRTMCVDDVAAEILGLDSMEATTLFEDAKDLTEVGIVCKAIMNHEHAQEVLWDYRDGYNG